MTTPVSRSELTDVIPHTAVIRLSSDASIKVAHIFNTKLSRAFCVFEDVEPLEVIQPAGTLNCIHLAWLVRAGCEN